MNLQKNEALVFNANERGQSAVETLLKNNNWNEKNLESKAIEELQNNNLNVISPGLPIPKEAK